ncbi:MAG: DNA polymerase ligase N-terminal domain-containing protein, partial [Janthinobacterium lividum]
MSLDKYHAKRNFAKTPEPRGEVAKSGQELAFFIQKHHASHLHYDFRLELDGTLKSWAVPKGPSLEPSDKRLAVLVEDHPLDYGLFEGDIPAGQYGGGHVIVWDAGTWTPVGDPAEGLRKGNLKFDLDGVKLQGRWALVRMGKGNQDGGKSKENWLLIKEKDDAARHGEQADVTTLLPDSVLPQLGKKKARRTAGAKTGAAANTAATPAKTTAAKKARPGAGAKRSSAAADADADADDAADVEAATKTAASKAHSRRVGAATANKETAGSGQAIAAPMPAMIQPQLATLADKAPGGDEWLCEVKFDGYRALCRIDNGEALLYTRNGNDWTAKWPGIAAAAAALPVEQAWLDGEVVAIDDDGNISFQALQNNVRNNQPERLVYYVFDLPYLNGVDLRQVPMVQRRELLQALVENSAPLSAGDAGNAEGKANARKGGKAAVKVAANGSAKAGKKPDAGSDASRKRHRNAPAAALPANANAIAVQSVPVTASGQDSPILFSSHICGDVAEIFNHACMHGLEGIIAKRADAPYASARNANWLKVKCQQRQEFVIGGYTDPAGARDKFGALLLGVFDAEGALHFVGRVGTGFDAELLEMLHQAFAGLASKRSPFAKDPPRTGAPAMHWLKPTLVAEVKFAQWTAAGIIRHASFVALRADKPAKSIRREQAVPLDELLHADDPAETDDDESGSDTAAGADTTGPSAGKADRQTETARSTRSGSAAGRPAGNAGKHGQASVAGVVLTHAARVLYPEIGFTKFDLAQYYEDIADWVLPHLAKRPMTLVRCPGGDGASCFFQKHVNATTSAAIEHIAVPSSTSGSATYMTATRLPSLIGMVQMGVLELHTWGAHAGKLDR